MSGPHTHPSLPMVPPRPWLMLSLLLLACESPKPPVTRGNDPWVLRATLDERPRMLILALHPRLWVAYDAERAALYCASQRSINFDGAVYNMHHGPQPATQGKSPLINDFPEPWRVLRDGKELTPRAQYRGHRFEGSQVVLSYSLRLDDATIEVEERPEALVAHPERPSFERRFKVRGVPDGAQLLLDFNAPELGATDDVRLVSRGAQLVGRLRLAADRETRLLIEFPEQAATSVPSAAAAQAPAERLLAESDCSTCHNPHSRTVGPAYKEIAARYKTTPDVIAGLATKIRQGGGDLWGDAAMVAHPSLSMEDATSMAEYILTTFDPGDKLGDTVTHPQSGEFKPDADFDPSKLVPGVSVEIFEVGHVLTALPRIEAHTKPNLAFISTSATLTNPADFRRSEPSAGFIARVRGFLRIDDANSYDFRSEQAGLVSFTIDQQMLIQETGPTGARQRSPWVALQLDKGLHAFELVYASDGQSPYLDLRWQPPKGKESGVAAAALRTMPTSPELEPGLKPYQLAAGAPGHGRPLTHVHPSFALRTIRPHDFKPMVGGIDFLAKDRAVITTWDARGAVYELSGLDGDPEQIVVKRIAEGLSEPLGLKVVDGQIYVLQKHELTRLVDSDGDGLVDDYQTVSNGWGSTGNFHEFAFGLAYRAGFFYATLAIGIEPGGAAMTRQHLDRGRVIRIAKDTGAVAFLARGLRTPNGIGFGVDGELFVTDNEGDWLPANKLIHVREGDFFGSYSVEPEVTKALPMTPPAAWLPVDLIANSPSEPVLLDIGPYKQQMLYGDVTYGGLNRVVLHKVGERYQGCALPFTQGLEAGINRVVVGPDGALYVGGIGNPGNWAQENKLWYGLQRLGYTGAPVFDMQDVELRSDGVAITFTEPMRIGDGDSTADYQLRQWTYVPTADYGGPRVDEHTLPIEAVALSADRKRVFVKTSGLRTGHVIHLAVRNPPSAESGRALWTGDAFCTLNTLPDTSTNTRDDVVQAPALPNRLSAHEQAAGVQLLFDGKTMSGWKGHRDTIRTGWVARDGWLTTQGTRGVDLVTQAEFENFELDFEWKVEPGKNGGVFYRATQEHTELWRDAVEYQLIDDQAQPSAPLPLHRAGAAYDLFAPGLAVAREPGEINFSRIVARGPHIEHWLNGHKVLAYEIQSASWERQLRHSKFETQLDFGSSPRGRIGLQHHGPGVSYRNLKVRAASPTTPVGHATVGQPGGSATPEHRP